MTLLNNLKNISLSFLYKQALDLSDSDPKLIAVGMAGGLLFELYGAIWMRDQIILRNSSISKISKLNNLLDYPTQKQILLLGESLYNLRGIKGIQNVLKMLQTGSIEAVVAELESGKLLFHRNLYFAYVTSNQGKRMDFDIHIKDGSNEIYCETKCKIDATVFSISSFHNSLHKAKKQLPRDCPSIILIKVPQNWGKHETELRNISSAFVRKSTRPLCIVCWYEKWVYINEMYSGNITTGFEEHNDKSKIYNSRLIPILPSTQNSPRWKSFEQFANGYL